MESVQSGATAYFFTGLSGAGKTTIGSRFFAALKEQCASSVFLDGDSLRTLFTKQTGYSAEDRNALAFEYFQLVKLLTDQGINVVICSICMFENVRQWNRENISDYKEIYIKVPIETLIERDQKGLYSAVQKGETSNVYGMDIEPEYPQSPELTIINDGSRSVDTVLNTILEHFEMI